MELSSRKNCIMATNDRMPKVDFLKDAPKIDQATLDYIKQVERKNIERVLELKRIRRNNIFTGLLLTAACFGIYGYSMYAVKQETFLDEYDEPKKDAV